VSALPTPKSRAELISLLAEACELEHGLACSYLYTAFSLKQRPVEGGLTIDQAHKAKFWASQIFFVASQEMLHLAQAWNLLSAIGGTPYCLRPNLPQSSRYYPLHARIALEPFGEKALKRFIVYETPTKAAVPWVRRQAALNKTEVVRGHVTIGQLYETIADGFCTLRDLFDGNPTNQVDRQNVQFSDLVTVRDTASALQAIQMITQQGEGTQIDRLDCHYGIFLGILKDFRAELAVGGAGFQPARPVMDNPVADSTHGYGAAAHPIKDPLTRQVAELFDAVYFLMLQALALAFTPAMEADASARSAGAAIELMTTVIRPIGDALTSLPAGVGNLAAGPGFGLTRFVPLPADPGLAVTLLRRRLDELRADADRLASARPASPQLEVAAARLRDVARRCSP
jgi:Ferritin-like